MNGALGRSFGGLEPDAKRWSQGDRHIEVAVYSMDMTEHIDRMVLFSGDGAFRALVPAGVARCCAAGWETSYGSILFGAPAPSGARNPAGYCVVGLEDVAKRRRPPRSSVSDEVRHSGLLGRL